MAKLSLTDLTSLQNEQTAVAALNANSAVTETALENTLSRDGTSPNQMESDLDMNSNRIFNLPDGVDSSEPITVRQFDALVMPEVVPVTIPVGIPSGGTGATTAAQALSNLGLREVLSANKNYYVATTGNDSNAGTVGSPFLTIQHAIDIAVDTLDTRGYTVTINVASGSYTGTSSIDILTGGGLLSIVGQVTPATCQISTVGTCFTFSNQARASIYGFRTISSTANEFDINGASAVQLSNIEFGPCFNYHIQVSGFSSLSITGPITINGNASGFLHLIDNSFFTSDASVWTLTGTPNFSVFFFGTSEDSSARFFNSFSGAATGRHAFIHVGSSVLSFDGSTHPDQYFPGDFVSTFTGSGTFNDYFGQGTFQSLVGSSKLIAMPAGGNPSVGLEISTTPNFGVYCGSGAPTMTAGQGSIYLRSDGSGVATRAYINATGTNGWVAITTVA